MPHLTLDKSNYQASTNGQAINLEPREFDILWLLAEKPGKTFKGKDLLGELQKSHPQLTENPFRKYINQLQLKLNERYVQMLGEDRFRLRF